MRTHLLIHRELLVASRRPSTYWSRGGAAAVLAFISIVFYGQSAFSPNPEDLGHQFFKLNWLACLGAMGCGVLLTADALGAERREGTLGLLLLTRLSGFEIATGKLIASSLSGAYALGAVFPIATLPFIGGGLTIQLTGLMLLAHASALLASLGIGLLASALCRDTFRAMSAAFLSLLVLTAGPSAIQVLVALRESPPGWAEWVSVISPASSIRYAILEGIGTTHGAYWISVLLHCLYGLGGFFGVVQILARFGDQEPASGFRVACPRAPVAHPTTRHISRPVRGPGMEDPSAWLHRRQITRLRALSWVFWLGALAWLVAFCVVTVLTPSLQIGDWFFKTLLLTVGLQFLVKLQAVAITIQHIGEAATNGELETLLTTPVSIRSWLLSHHQRVLQLLRPELYLMSGIHLALLAFLASGKATEILGQEAIPPLRFLILAGLIGLWTDVFAIQGLGIRTAIRRHRPISAVGAILLRLYLSVPAGILLLFAVPNWALNWESSPIHFALFSALQIGWSLFLGLRANSKLPETCRDLMSASHSTAPRLIHRSGGI